MRDPCARSHGHRLSHLFTSVAGLAALAPDAPAFDAGRAAAPTRSEAAGMDDIPQRKLEHVEITTRQAVTGSTGAGWADVRLLHACLPEVDKEGVDLSAELLGHPLRAPIVIAGMTGGHPQATPINAT